MTRYLPVLLLSFLYEAPSSLASQVLWESARFANNYLCSGSPNAFNGGFTFQLGAFEPGFTPTRTNLSEWLDHWTEAQSASYNPTTKFFIGSFVYAQSQSPFLPSNHGYIFAFHRTVKTAGGDQGEWGLVSNPAWKQPSGEGICPPVQWSVSNATKVIVGSINDPSEAFHRKTEKVSLTRELSGLQLWLRTNFPGLGKESSLTATLTIIYFLISWSILSERVLTRPRAAGVLILNITKRPVQKFCL